MTNEEALKEAKLRLNFARSLILQFRCPQVMNIKTIEFFKTVIKVIEKQIPLKHTDEFELFAPSFIVCGNCKKAIIAKDRLKTQEVRFSYCPYCGQAIDWSEEK